MPDAVHADYRDKAVSRCGNPDAIERRHTGAEGPSELAERQPAPWVDSGEKQIGGDLADDLRRGRRGQVSGRGKRADGKKARTHVAGRVQRLCVR